MGLKTDSYPGMQAETPASIILLIVWCVDILIIINIILQQTRADKGSPVTFSRINAIWLPCLWKKLGPGYRAALREGWVAYLKKTYPERVAKSWPAAAQDQLVVEADDADFVKPAAGPDGQ